MGLVFVKTEDKELFERILNNIWMLEENKEYKCVGETIGGWEYRLYEPFYSSIGFAKRILSDTELHDEECPRVKIGDVEYHVIESKGQLVKVDNPEVEYDLTGFLDCAITMGLNPEVDNECQIMGYLERVEREYLTNLVAKAGE